MKKLTVLLTAVMVFLQALSWGAAYGASFTPNDIVVTDYQTDKGNIYKDQEFALNLKFTNNSGVTLDEVSISVDNGSDFYIVGPNLVKVSGLLLPGGTQTASLKLVYKGTGNTLALDFTYPKGGAFNTSQTIFLRNAIAGSNPQTDASKLGLADSTSVKSVTAGQNNTLTYRIKNNSGQDLKSVKISMSMDDMTKAADMLGSLEVVRTFDTFSKDETKDVPFDLDVLKNAPEGVYSFKLNYSCQSESGDSFPKTSDTVYIKVQNNNEGPRLEVDSFDLTPDASAEEGTVNLKVNIKNVGDFDAKDVKVTLTGLGNSGYSAYNSTDAKYLLKIEGQKTETVTYRLKAPSDGAKAESGNLSVKMDYHDENGKDCTETNQIFLPVGSAPGKPMLAVEEIQSPKDGVSPNKDFSIGLDLKNTGEGAAKNIQVSVTTDKEIITRSLSTVSINSIEKEATKLVDFTLFATDEAVTKNYPIAVNLQYEDEDGTKYTATQYVGVYVVNGQVVKSVPRIIIDKYSFEPVDVKAGVDFKLKLSFLNTSRMVRMQNIKVTLTSDDGTFTPTNSGNTFYIDSIGMKKNAEEEILLHPKPDAEPKSYNLSVNFDYEDDKGNPYTSKDTVSIPVTQSPRLVTGDLSLPDQTFAGQPLQLYVDFYNMGKSILYNLVVKAEGDFQGQGLNYYVGNFQPGSTDSYQGTIIPSAPGDLKGNIVFSFEDSNGKQSEIKKEFSVKVTEMQQNMAQGGQGGMVVGPDGKTIAIGPDGKPISQNGGKRINTLMIAGAAAVVVIIGLVIFGILRKRHIRRKEMSLDE